MRRRVVYVRAAVAAESLEAEIMIVQSATGAASKELALDVQGLRLAARTYGPEDGEPVLALHGWLDNAASFDGLAPRLPPDLRVVALDLPGHGLSEHLACHATYHFVDWLGWVALVLDALRWPTATLLGHSMGAAIASTFAGASPSRVQRLVLIEGLGPETSTADETPDRVARALEQRRRRGTDGQGRSPSEHTDRETMVRLLCRALEPLTPASAERLIDRGTRKTPSGGYVWRADPRLRGTSALRLSEAQVTAFLRRITCPTLVIRAVSGVPFGAEQLQTRLACIQDATFVEIPGGHHVHLDDPGLVSDALVPFLRTRHPDGGPAQK